MARTRKITKGNVIIKIVKAKDSRNKVKAAIAPEPAFVDTMIDPRTFARIYGAEMNMKYTTALNLYKKNGFPSVHIGDRWYAAKCNIEEWIKNSAGKRIK